METPQGRTIKGLSIAVLICSILALVAALACTALFSAGAGFIAQNANSPEMTKAMNEALEELQEEGGATIDITEIEGAQDLIDAGIIDENGNITPSAATDTAFAGMGFVIVACVLIAIGALLTLIISIITLRRWSKPEKFNTVLVWAIIGAILCLACARWVIMVLFIIMAVKAYQGHPNRQNAYNQYAQFDQATYAGGQPYNQANYAGGQPVNQNAAAGGQPVNQDYFAGGQPTNQYDPNSYTNNQPFNQ